MHSTLSHEMGDNPVGLGGSTTSAMSLNFALLRGTPRARRALVRARSGFTLIEALIATALLGFSLIVMFGFHTQAVRSNLHARKMTDCTYLAQLQMERLIALPWSEDEPPHHVDRHWFRWTTPPPTSGPTCRIRRANPMQSMRATPHRKTSARWSTT